MNLVRTGSGELIVWTCCNMILELPILLSWALSLSFISDAFQGAADVCNVSPEMNSAISTFFAAVVTVSVSEFLLHAAVLVSAVVMHFDGSVLSDTRPTLLSTSASALTGLRLVLSLVATFVGIYVATHCEHKRAPAVILVFILTGWIAICLNLSCAAIMIRRRTRSRTIEDWKELARCLVCHYCWFGENRKRELEEYGFTSIAKNLHYVATDFPDANFSDTLLTLSLIRSLQIARRKLGSFSGDFVNGVNIHSASQRCFSGGIERSHLNRCQPELSPVDWDRIRLAKYYFKYSLGVYGAPLFAMMKPFSICCLWNCFQQRNGNIRSSGCCYCSIKAFLLRAGLTASELIYANLSSQAGTAVFYVCADHKMKALVISIRGTHSVQDLLNDLMIDLQVLDDYGFPGSHIHSGVLNASVKILKELSESAAIQAFLDAYPLYNIVITGHSLGAAIASTMALLSKKDSSISNWASRNLRCFAYAPLQMTDLAVAESVTASCITAVVFRNDVIPRLSLRSIRRLKILIASLLDIVRSYAHETALSRRNVISSALNKFQPNLAFVSDLAKDNGYFEAIENDMHLASEPKLYIPGRIFHVVEDKGCSAASKCCRLHKPKRTLIYPLDRASLDEILISKSMLLHHFPQTYYDAFKCLQVPEPNTTSIEIVLEH